MFNIVEKDINSIQAVMNNGEVTSRELVLAYLERISKYDKSGPNLNSILELNPDALFIAEAMDNERMTDGVRGPLHGIPVLLKDNINTHDKECRFNCSFQFICPLRCFSCQKTSCCWGCNTR